MTNDTPPEETDEQEIEEDSLDELWGTEEEDYEATLRAFA